MVSARTGLVWEFGARGTVELAYRGELETYPQVEDADRVLRQYGEGLARYRWTPLWETEFRVSYGQVERELTADYDELSASVAVDQRLSEHLALRYSLEWLRDAYDAPPGDDAAPEPQGPTVSTSLLVGGRGQGRPVAGRDLEPGLSGRSGLSARRRHARDRTHLGGSGSARPPRQHPLRRRVVRNPGLPRQRA